MNLRKPLILASNSPRRQQILRDCGFDFKIQVKDTNEDFSTELERENIPMYLAKKKAEAFLKESENHIILTSDTVVWVDNEVLNKPTDHAEAKTMLQKLSGKKHDVYTAVCILENGIFDCFFDKSEVYFKHLSDSEIDFYIKQYKPFDKAGAYGIQEWIGMIGIEKFVGSFYTVMGLPIHLVYEKLKKYCV
jgi:septum formation protein